VGTGYANPDAPTQIANGVSTTTFSYDADGNVTQKTVDGTTTTYVWDYANRLTALGVGGATTTYAYDWAGNRVSQTATSTTWIYPFKWYSVASSTGSGAQFATTTDYVFNGDSLVATVDQQTASGNATGTAKTKYIHPDHLGSTNVVTDDTGAVVQTLDYYPYGGPRINSTSGNYSGAGRQYLNRFADQTSLDYLNARYYDPGRGQFLTEDPVFWSSGQNLFNPQSLNSYSYAEDNPITKKDPDGQAASLAGIISSLKSLVAQLQSFINSFISGGAGGNGSKGGSSSGSTVSGSGGGVVAPNVIPPSAFVSQWGLSDPYTACKRACDEMGLSSGQDPIITEKYGPDGKSIVPTPGTRLGLDVINARLREKLPITVGVYMGASDVGNANPATQHFVKVVGANADQKGQYYNFYDPGTHDEAKGTSPQNRLYVGPNNSLRGTSVYNQDTTTYTVTEVDP
jgi:RHS repeat-associated protein